MSELDSSSESLVWCGVVRSSMVDVVHVGMTAVFFLESSKVGFGPVNSG